MTTTTDQTQAPEARQELSIQDIGNAVLGGYGAETIDTPPQQAAPPEAAPAAPDAGIPANAVPPPPDPFADLAKGPSALPAWPDEVKPLFKARGIEDPEQFITGAQATAQQLTLLQQQHAEIAALLETEKSLDPLAQELIQMAREKKDVFEWARQQSPIDLMKPAGKIEKMALVNAYFKDAFSAEEIAAYQAKDDPDMVTAIETRLDQWHKLAAVKHEDARKAPLEARQLEQAQRADFNKKYDASIAGCVTHVQKEAPSMGALVTAQTIEKFSSGKLLAETFCEADGMTPKPTALLDILFAQNRTAILKSVRESAMEAGRQEERLRHVSRLPSNAAQASMARLTPDQQSAQLQQHAEHIKSYGS